MSWSLGMASLTLSLGHLCLLAGARHLGWQEPHAGGRESPVALELRT